MKFLLMVMLSALAFRSEAAGVPTRARVAMAIEFDSKSNSVYHVQSSADMVSWSLERGPVVGSGSKMVLFNAVAVQPRFYRVVGPESPVGNRAPANLVGRQLRFLEGTNFFYEGVFAGLTNVLSPTGVTAGDYHYAPSGDVALLKVASPDFPLKSLSLQFQSTLAGQFAFTEADGVNKRGTFSVITSGLTNLARLMPKSLVGLTIQLRTDRAGQEKITFSSATRFTSDAEEGLGGEYIYSPARNQGDLFLEYDTPISAADDNSDLVLSLEGLTSGGIFVGSQIIRGTENRNGGTWFFTNP